MRLADAWGCTPREVTDRANSRELTELLAWDRIKRGVKPHDNAKAKAAMKAALTGGRKKKKGGPKK